MGPMWPFLLMYGSHDMRHIGFPRVDELSTYPRIWGVASFFSNMSFCQALLLSPMLFLSFSIACYNTPVFWA